MLIKKFTNFTTSIDEVEGIKAIFFHDDNNQCWYDISDSLDKNPGQYLVVGCQKEGWVNWMVKEKVRSTHAPHPEGSVYVFELNDLPDDLSINTPEHNRLKIVDDKLVRVSTLQPRVIRSKEDILRDLDRLREELLSVKE